MQVNLVIEPEMLESERKRCLHRMGRVSSHLFHQLEGQFVGVTGMNDERFRPLRCQFQLGFERALLFVYQTFVPARAIHIPGRSSRTQDNLLRSEIESDFPNGHDFGMLQAALNIVDGALGPRRAPMRMDSTGAVDTVVVQVLRIPIDPVV